MNPALPAGHQPGDKHANMRQRQDTDPHDHIGCGSRVNRRTSTASGLGPIQLAALSPSGVAPGIANTAKERSKTSNFRQSYTSGT